MLDAAAVVHREAAAILESGEAPSLQAAQWIAALRVEEWLQAKGPTIMTASIYTFTGHLQNLASTAAWKLGQLAESENRRADEISIAFKLRELAQARDTVPDDFAKVQMTPAVSDALAKVH
jgi:hypothetical protein